VGLQFPAARRAARERLLASAGRALLAAPDADAVRRVSAAATAELLGLPPAADGDEFAVLVPAVADEPRPWPEASGWPPSRVPR
jgi:hypothetical protein